MIAAPFKPTEQQVTIIGRDGPAFVRACPGAGKTRTMVERARRALFDPKDRRGVAFLSFTNAAIDELQTRLATFGALPTPLFPSYIGTFDRFLWQFIITPFGVPGCVIQPRLVPDKGKWEIKPSYSNAQGLPLFCFDRQTGLVIPALALDEGYDTSERNIKAHETMAKRVIDRALKDGQVDFDDVRACVEQHLSDAAFEARIGTALSARFREVIVDEAQDCNPGDLRIIERLKKAGIPVKVICDPDQSIYAFRGGVTVEFQAFAGSFSADNTLPMTGNFRSTPAICKAISALRPSDPLGVPDDAIGELKEDVTPVHVVAYPGNSIPASIGTTFRGLVADANIDLAESVVLASTWKSGAKAIGQAYVDAKNNMTLNLARAVMDFHFAFALGGLKDALTDLHATILWIQGHISTIGGYHRYIQGTGLDDGRWRPALLELARSLKYDPAEGEMAWLLKARAALSPDYVAPTGINLRLKGTKDLKNALAAAPAKSCSSRTIHSAKGLEFPAVCVVLTTKTAGKIMDLLEGTANPAIEEEARKIYVSASRAQKLLAMAVPASQCDRLATHLAKSGAEIIVHKI